jgi:hypothetical protein
MCLQCKYCVAKWRSNERAMLKRLVAGGHYIIAMVMAANQLEVSGSGHTVPDTHIKCSSAHTHRFDKRRRASKHHVLSFG